MEKKKTLKGPTISASLFATIMGICSHVYARECMRAHAILSSF